MKLRDLGCCSTRRNRRKGIHKPVGQRQQIRRQLVKAFRQQCGAERIAILIFGGGGVFVLWDRRFAFQTRERVCEGVTGAIGGLETRK